MDMEPGEFLESITELTEANKLIRGRPSNIEVWVEDEADFLHLIESVKPANVFFWESMIDDESADDSKIVGAALFFDHNLIGIQSTPDDIEEYQKREEGKKEELFHRLRALEDYVPHVPSQDRLDRYTLEELQVKVEEAEKRRELVSRLEDEGIDVPHPSRQTIRELERMIGNSKQIREAQKREKEIAEEVASSARYNLGLSRKAVNLLIEDIAPEVEKDSNINKSNISELARAYRSIKVRPKQMEKAKTLLEEGSTQKEVSEILGVSTSLVREASRREQIW